MDRTMRARVAQRDAEEARRFLGSEETMTTGGGAPRAVSEGWTNLGANDSMPARDSGLMVAPKVSGGGAPRTPAKAGQTEGRMITCQPGTVV